MKLYNQLPDERLCSLLTAGDHMAYLEIFNRYQPLVFSFAIKKIADEEETKDIVQDIFIDLWERRNSLRADSNLPAYLFKCVKFKFIDLLKRKNIRDQYLISFLNFVQQSSEKADYLIRNNQMKVIIDKEIDALPPKMREIFIKSRKDHLGYKEIAIELSISEETVRSQVKNALRILRSKLGFLPFLSLILFY